MPCMQKKICTDNESCCYGAVTLRGVRPQARKVLDAAGLDRFVTVE